MFSRLGIFVLSFLLDVSSEIQVKPIMEVKVTFE